MTRSRSPNSVLDNNILNGPERFFGYLAFCDDGLYRVTDFDDTPDIMELVGQPCTVDEFGQLCECESQCEQCLQSSDVILFITPDVEKEFVTRYHQQSMHALMGWLFDDDDDENTSDQETGATSRRDSHNPPTEQQQPR